MKAFLEPLGLHSKAMIRVTNALTEFAPADVKIVYHPEQADFQLIHVIGFDSLEHRVAPECAIIQYCLTTVPLADDLIPYNAVDAWRPLWEDVKFIWSYYDIRHLTNKPVYYAPLGVDDRIFRVVKERPRLNVITSGFVSGPGAEPIEEMARAAEILNKQVIHIGPPEIVGMKHYPLGWSYRYNISDDQLVSVYNSAQWVSGMRHVEGFEMPVTEGLLCGARPIVFDRPDMRQWYDGHAVFVQEQSGEALVADLVKIMSTPPAPVAEVEKQYIRWRFSWRKIAADFWKMVLSS